MNWFDIKLSYDLCCALWLLDLLCDLCVDFWSCWMWFVSGCGGLCDLVSTLIVKDYKNIRYLKDCKFINYKELKKNYLTTITNIFIVLKKICQINL